MSKEVAVVHSAHSAVAINDFISSLDLKGESYYGIVKLARVYLMQYNTFHCGLRFFSTSF